MRLADKYQNDLYSLAVSLIYDTKKSKKAVIKAFESVLSSYNNDSDEMKLKLYKKLLDRIGFFSVNKKHCVQNGCAESVKKKLGIFDKKVFVLKYEHGLTVDEICAVLDAKQHKVKRSLLKSTQKAADAIEGAEDEMQRSGA